jgi:hypothetical protein
MAGVANVPYWSANLPDLFVQAPGLSDISKVIPLAPCCQQNNRRGDVTPNSYLFPEGSRENSGGNGLSGRSWSHRMLSTHQRLPSFNN